MDDIMQKSEFLERVKTQAGAEGLEAIKVLVGKISAAVLDRAKRDSYQPGEGLRVSLYDWPHLKVQEIIVELFTQEGWKVSFEKKKKPRTTREWLIDSKVTGWVILE